MNNARMSGTMTTPPYLLWTANGEEFYTFDISVKRDSGIYDMVPVIIKKDNLIDSTDDRVTINGEIRSRNSDGHLLVYFYATESMIYSGIDENVVALEGIVCIKKEIRETLFSKKKITDFSLAVDRKYNWKSDYIPCIAWEHSAEVINDDIAVGTGIGITGRFQSRDYMKNGEKKTAFEVSVMNLEW
jgi:single-strand DNA-binding protein